jgi:ABC-type maltose transport system permease subunit
VTSPPVFTLDNYRNVLRSEGIGQAFINSMTVAVPATIIPILIAAFAAYALSWMKFAGRTWMIALVVGLIVVPLQMSLIPLLRLYNDVGNIFGVPSKTYAGIWLAHTAFGLPLAIYLLRNYISSLPKEIIESARVDGASDARIFRDFPVPLDLERPLDRHGVPWNAEERAGADRRVECTARLARRQLGNPYGFSLRDHHRTAFGVFCPATLPRARIALRLG